MLFVQLAVITITHTAAEPCDRRRQVLVQFTAERGKLAGLDKLHSIVVRSSSS